jgi:anti-sigma B factor antagonist
MNMEIIYNMENDIGIIKIIGKLNVLNAEEFKKSFDIYLKETSNFVFDLSELEFIDSTGLGCLISSLKKSTEKKGDIKIFNLQTKPRIVFDLTRAFRIFEIFEDKQSAMESFKK